jgi:serine phosphatase RsbU (regulator of sigma subunit)/anti-sigma regulatory factor (Ser/Thr protein kinase)
MHGPSAACQRPASLRILLRCDLGEVRHAVGLAHDFLAEHGWTSGQLMSFDLALVEACNNAVKYAGEAGRKEPVEISVDCDAGRVEFRIQDHTPGFDWPREIALPGPECESGRGLYLIKSLMDSAAYFRGRNGNILVLRKARSPESRAGTPPKPVVHEDASRRLAQSEQVIHEMVEELSSCYECLSAIFRYSAELSGRGNLQEFATRLFTDLLQIVSADWFVVRLAAGNGTRLEVLAASEPWLEFPLEDRLAQSVELEAARTGKRVWFQPPAPGAEAGSLQRAKPHSAGLVYPIVLGEVLIGTLAVGKPFHPEMVSVRGKAIFTAAQTQVVNMFADFLAIQIVNARAQEQQVSQRLVTHELEIAKKIQRSLLLAELPQLPGFSLAGFCRSANAVGGDFYDVLGIDDHSLLLIIADVMGKGVPAAMFAAILRSLLRVSPELANQPAALLTRVNRQLYPELSGVEMFITAQLVFVNARERKIVTASAGHCPLAIADAHGVKTFSPEGMPLGILPDTAFHDEMADLPAGCRVLLYTDGVSDAFNAKREHFGQQRLMDWLKRATAVPRTAENLKYELARELDTHQQNAVLYDDQTFLIMAG